jgi:hypothetical protein
MCIGCAQGGLAVAESVGIDNQTSKFLVIATSAVMLFATATPMINPATTIKAGVICTKANQKLVKAGKTYICKKSGTKFVWRVQKKKSKASTPPVTAPNANAQPEPPAQPQQKIEDNYQSIASNLDICRLRETQNIIGAGPKGFPMRSKVPHVGNVKIAIIPVDFGNAVGVGNPGEMYQDDLKEIVDWGNFYGRGKVQYQPYLVSKDWLRAPRGAEWYACVECRKGATTEKQPLRTGFQELINLADPLFDFTNTHFVYFVFPLEAEVKYGTSMYFHRINMQTQEGVMEVSAYGELGGSYWAPSAFPYPRDTIWSHLLHEILHFQGWIGHGPFFELNIMISDWGPSRAVTSWEAFLASWFGEKEIICLEKSKIDKPIYVSQDSIDTMGNAPVSTMIKLSNDEVLVIERRSNGKYSNFSNANNAGGLVRDLNHFTAYFVNVNAQYANLDWNDLTSSKPNFWKYIREGGQIKITKSVTYQGITLEVINKEQIKISVN